MTPRKETLAEGVEIWLGDCRDVLPLIGRVDAVVTDPPYGLGDRMQGGTWAARPVFKGMPAWDQKPPSSDVLLALCDIADAAIFWGGNVFDLPRSRGWLVWSKANAVPTMADCEFAWTNLDRPAKRYDGNVGRANSGHPTEKPLELMKWCLGFVPGAGTIFDPFMGSGTTGVACVNLGRRFIGVELEPKYYDIARRRITEALRQTDIFIDKPKPIVQESLL